VHPDVKVAPFFIIHYNPFIQVTDKKSMPEPLIGITSGYCTIELKYLHSCLSRKYTQAIIRAGGIPLILPANLPASQLTSLLPKLDGILFSGGDEVNPKLYGEDQLPETKKVLDERDEIESVLLKSCLEQGKPVFGICRGIQIINVVLGGSLYQHIQTQYPGAIQHDRHDDIREKRRHSVTVTPGSLLARLTGLTSIQVNTLHHQGIRDLAKGLNIGAKCSEDGLIEAVEIADQRFFLAVQWHPEELTEYPEQRSLFEAFVKACQPD
jgi:putative glutamine amidotransferase